MEPASDPVPARLLRGWPAGLDRRRDVSERRIFNGRDGRPGLFHKFAFETGYANGLNSFQ
jgi:hypothetical protein